MATPKPNYVEMVRALGFGEQAELTLAVLSQVDGEILAEAIGKLDADARDELARALGEES